MWVGPPRLWSPPNAAFVFLGYSARAAGNWHCLRNKSPGQGEAPRQTCMEYEPPHTLSWAVSIPVGRPIPVHGTLRPLDRCSSARAKGRFSLQRLWGPTMGFLPKWKKHSKLVSKMPTRGSQG